MTEPRDGLVERLAKRWAEEADTRIDGAYIDAEQSEWTARWWLLAIAEEAEEVCEKERQQSLLEGGVFYRISRWLRTEAERR